MTKPTKSKKVKAWAIIKKGKIMSVEMSTTKPTRFTVGTWLFFIEPDTDVKAVPCEITYKIN